MSFIKKLFAVLVLLQVLLFSVPVLAAPAEENKADQYGLGTTAGRAKLPGVGEEAKLGVPALVGLVINGFLSLIGIAFFILMLWGGFIWMKARGNESEVERAKNMLTNAIIGMIVVGAAYTITNFVLGLVPGA